MSTICLGCMEPYESGPVCPHCGYRQDAPPRDVYCMTPGTVVKNRYLVGRSIGSGGFGVTYIAYDQKFGRKVAIKEYLPAECATRMEGQKSVSVYAGEKQEQFLAGMKKSIEEAQYLADLQNAAGIIQIMDYFEENNTAYIVMEYLEGMTLKEKLKKDGVMTVEEALPIVLGVIAALKTAHAQNILHRDIAPDNIYLLNDGSVKLIDFGASRQVTTGYSKSLTVLLKVGYAPVEQYERHGDQGPWTDVYALAATFYKMITGKRPVPSVDRRIQDTLALPSSLGVKISKNMENALMNALQVNIRDRTQSAEAFEQALCSTDPVKRTVATVEKNDLGGWPLWLKAVCALAVVGAVGGGAFALTRKAPEPVVNMSEMVLEEGFLRMPSLINLSQEAARGRAEAYGLEFAVGGAEASDTIPKGYVIRQEDGEGGTLRPGVSVEAGSTVSVIISSGNGKSVIPDILYMDQEKALKLLEDEELIVVDTETSEDGWGAEGLVLAVSPEIGSEVEQKERIVLTVAAAGREASPAGEVPDLTGLTQEQAYERLKASGFYLEKERVDHDVEIPQGHVMSQTPAAGSKAAGTAAVRIVVSSGPREVLLPDLTSWTEAEALAQLEELGLVAGEPVREYNEEIPEGTVLSQDRESGMLLEGTTVTLTISRGKEPEQPAARPGGSSGRTGGSSGRTGGSGGSSGGAAGGSSGGAAGGSGGGAAGGSSGGTAGGSGGGGTAGGSGGGTAGSSGSGTAGGGDGSGINKLPNVW